MNKKIILSQLVIFLVLINSYGQISFQNYIVSDTTGGVTSVFASDLDGDGDLDILSASSNDTIGWYENVDGQGNFGVQRLIAIVNDGRSVFAQDLNGDGKIDVLSASINDNKIAWYENIDGQGNFSTEKVISTNANLAGSVHSSDLDGDGDMDVLSASLNDNKIAWYENIDGLGNFSTEKIISTNAISAWSAYSSDLDGDGDLDILSASVQDDKIAWYENTDGQANFSTEKIITTNANAAKSVFASDLDNDGDMDVLSASQLDDKIAWYENMDGQGNFSSEQIISTNLDGAISVYAADLDGDNDMDVLGASQNNGKIMSYENIDGMGTFEVVEPSIINYNSAATCVYAVDLDGDNDIDVLSSSIQNTIAWHENLNITSTFQNSLINFEIFPVPVEDILMVQSQSEIIQINIFNYLGQLILANTNQTRIDTSSLKKGIYLCMVKNVNNEYGIRKVIKK